MKWFYVQGGEQQGPVDEAELIELRSIGEVKDATLVWKEGMPDWVPFSSVPIGLQPPSDSGSAGSAPEVGDVESSEGAPTVVPAAGASSSADGSEGVGDPADLMPEDFEVEIESCIRRAWELMKGNFWPIVGISALIWIAYVGASSVPFIGSVLPLFFAMPLFAGLYYYYLMLIRGKEASVGEAFAGFSRNLGQLVLLNLIVVVGVLVAMIPGIVILSIGFAAASRGDAAAAQATMGGMAILGMIVATIPALYLQIAWMFAPILCIDRMIGFWDAAKISMRTVNKQLLSVVLFYFVIGLLGVAGMLALCVGMFVAIPLGMLAMTYLYEDIFGELGKRSGAS